jgi:hypothetical protein
MQYTGTRGGLAELYLASRSMLAAEIDAGRITKEQANVKMGDVSVSLNQVAAERSRANAISAAAILSAMPRSQPYQVPFYPMVAPSSPVIPTNCMQTGSMVNCRSY